MITVSRKTKTPYVINVENDDNRDQLIDWCTEQFGKGGRDATRRWRFGWVNDQYGKLILKFHFKHHQDASWFALMWL